MEKETLKNKAYHIIREKIVSCQYHPGSFLSESQLIGEVGSSRTPIREALNKLEQEDLVRIIPKRGVWVSEVTVGVVNSVYEIRNLVEPYIVQKYASAIPQHRIEGEIQRIHHENDPNHIVAEEAASLDEDLHQMLVNASNNPYIIDMMNTVYTQNHRIRILSTVTVENRYADTQDEHLAILEHIQKGDIEAAVESMRHHLANSQDAAIKAMLAGNLDSFYLREKTRSNMK